eukprot:COSAG06_NODE_3558_length_5190_cov_2.023178_1_plen_63_part_10
MGGGDADMGDSTDGTAAGAPDDEGFIDLTADGGLKKKVLTAGSGEVCRGALAATAYVLVLRWS